VHVAHHQHVDEPGVLAQGVVVQDVHRLHLAELGHDLLDDPVDADVLADDGVDLREEGMAGVGLVVDAAALLALVQIAGGGQAVQLLLDGVGRGPELLGQLPQIAGNLGIQEQLEQQLDARARGEQLRQHAVNLAPPYDVVNFFCTNTFRTPWARHLTSGPRTLY